MRIYFSLNSNDCKKLEKHGSHYRYRRIYLHFSGLCWTAAFSRYRKRHQRNCDSIILRRSTFWLSFSSSSNFNDNQQETCYNPTSHVMMQLSTSLPETPARGSDKTRNAHTHIIPCITSTNCIGVSTEYTNNNDLILLLVTNIQ